MPRIRQLSTSVYVIPTDRPESDGTLEWDSTTIVVVEAFADDQCGLGYSYSSRVAAGIVHETLAAQVVDKDVFQIPELWAGMVRAVRNLGRPGIASAAVSAVDSALWDLKARLLKLPLASVIGSARDRVPVYGSGGFTSYTLNELQQQLGAWVESGIRMVKMKVGRDPEHDPERVSAARRVIGDSARLFVDANGAYTIQQALRLAEVFKESAVSWFEEPVSSDDLRGLRMIRRRAPAGMEIAAGEYGHDAYYFRRMLEAGAVDVLQADATRCGGISGFLKAAQLADAFQIPLSAHTAPALHLHACCAAPRFAHLEYFHDHTRIEEMLFDGAAVPEGGVLRPDLSRPGNGLAIKRSDAAAYAA